MAHHAQMRTHVHTTSRTVATPAAPRTLIHQLHTSNHPHVPLTSSKLNPSRGTTLRPRVSAPSAPPVGGLLRIQPPVGAHHLLTQAPPEAAAEPVDVATIALPVVDGVVCLRNVCNQRLKFEIEYGLKRGTTDNTYVLTDADGVPTVLVDVPDNSFASSVVDSLQQLGPLDRLATLVITHLTPKRLQSLHSVLAALLDAGAPVEVWLSNPAMQLLQASAGSDEALAALLPRISIQVAKPGSTIAMPSAPDAPLNLIPTPTPRWPDLLTIYSPQHSMLLSSKLFSAHVSPELAVDDAAAVDAFDAGGWATYARDWRYFFECTLAPVAGQVAAALERLDLQVVPTGTSKTLGLEAGWLVNSFQGLLRGLSSAPAAPAVPRGSGLEVALIAPLHGPVIKYAAQELLRNYGKWTADQVASTQDCGILVLYASAYGNTAALAQAISRGITKAGVGVEQLNLETCSSAEVEAALARARGFVIGSPTLGGHMPTQVQTAVGTILAAPNALNLPTGVFGSFGWSGEAVDMLEQKFKDAGFVFGFQPIRCKFKPTAAMLQVCEESGTDIAQLVRRRKRREDQVNKVPGAQPVVGGTGAQSALGRVVGSLCVVTARDGDAESAMLASWISQASFDPPGLTIAVKRDRAVEPLLPVGAKFVVNILAEGGDRAILKQLMRVFRPGEDRFEGIDCEDSEVSGCKIIKEGAAYLECTMRDKMEAGDHYVLYAAVDDGQVLQQNALAAVHHRKIGTTY